MIRSGQAVSAPVALHAQLDGPPDAPPLLLGNSLGTTLEMWDPQVAALADAFRIVRCDTRGHGRSPVPEGPYTIADLGGDVLALMDRLQIERAAYCGLSIGGMIAQWLAINAPERIERVIVLCSTGQVGNGDAFRERAATVRDAGGAEGIADAVVSRWFTADFAEAQPDVIARHRAMIASSPAEGYAGCCEAVAGHDERAGLGAIRAATLVVSGAQDEAIPAAQGRALANAIPRARFELLDPGAHLANVERADVVSELIAEHLS